MDSHHAAVVTGDETRRATIDARLLPMNRRDLPKSVTLSLRRCSHVAREAAAALSQRHTSRRRREAVKRLVGLVVNGLAHKGGLKLNWMDVSSGLSARSASLAAKQTHFQSNSQVTSTRTYPVKTRSATLHSTRCTTTERSARRSTYLLSYGLP